MDRIAISLCQFVSVLYGGTISEVVLSGGAGSAGALGLRFRPTSFVGSGKKISRHCEHVEFFQTRFIFTAPKKSDEHLDTNTQGPVQADPMKMVQKKQMYFPCTGSMTLKM